MNKYIAHIKESNQEEQTVKEHSENTAVLCESFAIPELKSFMYQLGLLHDLGKYQASFQKRIHGASIKIEHSICGAQIAKKYYQGAVALLMEYCIAGHHSGIPNGGTIGDSEYDATLFGRLKRKTEDFSVFKEELKFKDFDMTALFKFLANDCNYDSKRLVDKFSFFTRYAFSCLTDADSIDTANFCTTEKKLIYQSDFKACLNLINEKLDSFVCITPLQKARAGLQNQVFQKRSEDARVFFMNMPTGSGKTLCSIKFALERVLLHNKKRIIYIIPYTSIIDQTVDTFESIFKQAAVILRHQSSFSYDEDTTISEDYRASLKKSIENWDADFIVTTSVQFFESVYGNKRGKLRKLHNMADSVLIFDEAHLLPVPFLQPCMQAIAFITQYLNSEAVFLTATMPDYEELFHRYTFGMEDMKNLITDTSSFRYFKKCTYKMLPDLSQEELLINALDKPTCLIIVNRKKTAQEIYKKATGKIYHLSTYMIPIHRQQVITEIRHELSLLEKDFPNLYDVPKNRRIMVVSTSLIEAGVDFDFHTVYREMTGLDSILQAGGRCNREGKRDLAVTYVFSLKEQRGIPHANEKVNLTKGLFEKYKDISSIECIKEYYNRLYFMHEDEIIQHTMSENCSRLESIPFADYAERFELIDSKTESVFLPIDEFSINILNQIKFTGKVSERKVQKYVASVSRKELEELKKQHVIEDYGTGIWCLINTDYYDKKLGITFESKDYIL